MKSKNGRTNLSKDKTRYSLLAKNTAIFAIGNVLIKIISFFLLPLYTSVLTTEQYGIAELLNNGIEIILPIATLCITEALYRFSIDKKENRATLFTNSLLIVVLGDAVVSIVGTILFFIFKNNIVLHFILLYIATTLYKTTSQFARGLGHSKRFAVYGVINSIVLVISNIILLVIFKKGISAYLLSFSISYSISAIIAFILSKEYEFLDIHRIQIKKLKEMLAYSIPSIPNMLSWWINSASDRYIILLYAGASSAGLYTAASKLPAIVNLLTTVFQQAWQYSTAKEIGSKDSNKFFENVFRSFSYICCIICILLIIGNKWLCKVLLQSSFYDAWIFVPLLLLAATFGSIGTFFGTFYNAIKNNKMLMISTLIGAIINILLNIALIPFWGGMGAAIATAISYFVVMIIRILHIKKIMSLKINNKIIFQLILLVIAAIVAINNNLLSVIVEIICLLLIIMSDIEIAKKIILNSFSLFNQIIRRDKKTSEL